MSIRSPILDAASEVAPLPDEPPMNGGLSGPALDAIADRLIHAAKRGLPIRLEDVRKLVVHLHSTEAYAALRLSAYTNNALGLELLAENHDLKTENARLRAALEARSATAPPPGG